MIMRLKKIKKRSTMIVITLLIMGSMYYCNKDHSQFVTNEDETFLIEKSNALEKHVLTFKSKMERYRDNPSLKTSGDLYTADSAVIEIESLINYDSANINILCNQKTLEVSEIIMPLNEVDKINDPDLMQVYYDKIMDSITSQMNRVNYSKKRLLLTDLTNIGTDGNGDAIIKITSLIGNQQTVVLHNDNWWYGENLGLCSTHQYAPEDGASQLDMRVTNYMLPDPPSGATWWFRGITSTYITPTSDPLTTDFDNYLDYKIFYATTENGLVIDDDVKCMSQYEMNFYEGHYINYAQDLETTSRKFANCVLVGVPLPNPYRIQHKYTIFVGERLLIWHE